MYGFVECIAEEIKRDCEFRSDAKRNWISCIVSSYTILYCISPDCYSGKAI